MSALAQLTLGTKDWLQRATNHRSNALEWTQPTRDRRARGEKHPVHDFLHTYYRLSLGQLERWHPGIGVHLEDCPEAHQMFRETHYRFEEGTCAADPSRLSAKARARLEFSLQILQSTMERPPNFSCHGLHEWAMLYDGAEVRHGETVPLRLPREDIDTLVRSRPLCCSHFDAFRFFAPGAKVMNRLQPDLWAREDTEQPGCIHANMDLYKWAAKSLPWVSSDLLWQCFRLATRAREIDMRASPYDLSGFGYNPIPVESSAGRRLYEKLQRQLAQEARALRESLILQLEQTLRKH